MRGYVRVVPQLVRTGIGHVLANPKDLGSALNLLLQGRVVDGLSDVARFGVNTTVGVLGVFDVATPLDLPRHGEDFGQTLGRWGIGPGAYIVWPLLGPSSLRETAALPVDYMASPSLGPAALPLEMTSARRVAAGERAAGQSRLRSLSLRARCLPAAPPEPRARR